MKVTVKVAELSNTFVYTAPLFVVSDEHSSNVVEFDSLPVRVKEELAPSEAETAAPDVQHMREKVQEVIVVDVV